MAEKKKKKKVEMNKDASKKTVKNKDASKKTATNNNGNKKSEKSNNGSKSSIISKIKKNKKTQIQKESGKQLAKVKKAKFKNRHPKLSIALKIILLLIIVLIVVAAGVVIGVIYGAFGEEFEIKPEELIISMMNSYVVDQDGNVLAELNGEDGKRTIIKLDDIKDTHLVDAYIAIEDERFYDHEGVDLYRTAGAIFTYITHGGNSSFGGSTITQQLVKNFTSEKQDKGIEGIKRKVKEWVKAYQVEQMLTKEQILELYLNLIFVGGKGNYGVGTAANYYFNKNASNLTLLECAFLAGINSNPNLYNPYGENGYGVNETKTTRINSKIKVVLGKMLEIGKIKQEEYDVAIKELEEQGIKFTQGGSTNNYSYHTDALLNQVAEEIAEQKNVSKSVAYQYICSSGLTIYSTQVSSIQQQTEEAVNNAVKLTAKYNENGEQWTEESQAAMVVIDHKTGYVVGCVGGVGTKEARGLNRATQSIRQPGSTIKPIIAVAPAIEEKIITAGTIYNDSYTQFKVGSSIYDPKNYNYYRGNITVRQAVETSQNIPFVKIVAELGVDKAIQYLEQMGVSTLDKERDGLSLSIGGATNGISPLEMAAAYATIANDGVYIEPTFYTKVVDKDGNTVLTATQETHRVFSETTASIVKNILTEPVKGANGTAKACAISGIDVAAKTGTTNGDKDRWLCGFTNYYTASVWYGFDTPSQIVVNGISPATRIWAAGMKSIHSGLARSTFSLTNNVVTATICRDSGKLASDTCYNTYSEIFEKGTIPESCEGHIGYTICNETQLLANPYCTSTSEVYRTYLVDKEKTDKWVTEANQQENYIPTEYCTVHQYVAPLDPEPEPVTPPSSTEPEKPGDETNKPTNPPDESGDNKPPEGGDSGDENNKPPEGGGDDKDNTQQGSNTNKP